MRKKYSSPSIRQMRIGTTEVLVTSLAVNPSNTIENSADGGWSKKFWGLTDEDEEPESEFDWQ